MECDLKDHVERQIWFFGSYEPIESYIFCRLLKPGMVVVDAGANIGQYSLLASTAVKPGGAVHSFEPVESNFRRLTAHVGLNDLTNVEVNRAALWSHDTRVTMHHPDPSDCNAGSFHIDSSVDDDRHSVPALQLDEYVHQRGMTRLDLIKMDIEGAELGALQGARSALDRFGPMILIEINREALANLGASPEQIWQLLTGMGYLGWALQENTLRPIEPSEVPSLVRTNALFFRGDLPPLLQGAWPTIKQILRWARSRGKNNS